MGLVGKGAATYSTTLEGFVDFLYQYSNAQPWLVFGLVALGVVISVRYWRQRMWWALLVWLVGGWQWLVVGLLVLLWLLRCQPPGLRRRRRRGGWGAAQAAKGVLWRRQVARCASNGR
mgnify:CR=1 FL=1